MFAKGKEVAQKYPLALIIDGAYRTFIRLLKKEFRTANKPRTVYISSITLKEEHNNNKMEG
jgi:hypothetical protein